MNKEHLAVYTVQVPVTFKFGATERLEGKALWDMAEAYAAAYLSTGKFDYKNENVEVIKKEVHYTKEELEEQERYWAEILRKADRL